MIPSYFKRNNNTKQDKEAIKQNISKVIDGFKENPEAWNAQSMGDEDMAREKILNRLLFSISNTESKREYNVKRIYRLSAAAILLAGLSVGFLFKDAIIDHLITYPQVIVETKPGQHERINLPDGSVVILNASTKLSYPTKFKHSLREVTLVDGEAYFEVKHDDEKPFQVHAGKTLTNVLGTAFNISSYSYLQQVSVTVSSGKVAVNNETLLPNQQFVYHKSSGQIQKKNLNASNVSSWIQGDLAFNDEDFKTVATILERKYGVLINFEDQAMEDFHFSARYEPNAKLLDILDDLTLTRGLQYEFKQNKITIKN